MKIPFFICFVLSTLSLSSSQHRPAPVHDINGNILRSGTNYYILPAMRGMGGGLTLARAREGEDSCLLLVVQEDSEVRNGMPVNFSPANKDGIIRESVDTNVKFTDRISCAPDTVWRVNPFHGQRAVSSNGVVGRPGRETVNNWLKIEKYEDHYKLVYCPSVCHTCRPDCADVGSSIDEKGRRSLVLNNKPLKVYFKKA